MKSVKRGLLAALIGAGLCWSPAVVAGPACQLKQAASLDIVRTSDADLLIPVNVNGADVYFKLSPSMTISAITAAAANAVHLRRSSIPQNLSMTLAGQQVKEQVAADLKLGHAAVRAFLAVSYGALGRDPRVAGILGYDVLKMMDVELDLGHGKVRLFSQDHCPHQVIYWTRSAPVAAIPLQSRGLHSQTFYFDMTLDGETVKSQVEPSVPDGMLSSRAARLAFGIAEDESRRMPRRRRTTSSRSAPAASRSKIRRSQSIATIRTANAGVAIPSAAIRCTTTPTAC